MGFEFDDDATPVLPLPGAAAKDPENESALAPGQLVYEVLADVVAELDKRVLLAVVTALQGNTDWSAVAPAVRAAFVQVERELFVDEGGQAA